MQPFQVNGVIWRHAVAKQASVAMMRQRRRPVPAVFLRSRLILFEDLQRHLLSGWLLREWSVCCILFCLSGLVLIRIGIDGIGGRGLRLSGRSRMSFLRSNDGHYPWDSKALGNLLTTSLAFAGNAILARCALIELKAEMTWIKLALLVYDVAINKSSFLPSFLQKPSRLLELPMSHSYLRRPNCIHIHVYVPGHAAIRHLLQFVCLTPSFPVYSSDLPCIS